jgi:hypothetical protein
MVTVGNNASSAVALGVLALIIVLAVMGITALLSAIL